MKIKSLIFAITILLIQEFAFAGDGSPVNQKALCFVNTLFQSSTAASRNLSQETLLNGTETQTGFCKLVQDSVLMDSLIPFVAGKDVWAAGTEKQKKDFILAAYSNLSIFIALAFQNYTQGDPPDFFIADENTTDKNIDVKVVLPNDKTDLIIKLKYLGHGNLKVYDSIVNGISTMQNKKADFACASQGSLETLTARISMANKRSGYGECRIDQIASQEKLAVREGTVADKSLPSAVGLNDSRKAMVPVW